MLQIQMMKTFLISKSLRKFYLKKIGDVCSRASTHSHGPVFCFFLFPVVVIKHHDRKWLGGERVYFSFQL